MDSKIGYFYNILKRFRINEYFIKLACKTFQICNEIAKIALQTPLLKLKSKSSNEP